MTLAELRQQLESYGLPVTDLAYNRALNTAYRGIAGARHWSWLQGQNTAHTLAINTSSTAVTITDLRAIEAVRLRAADGTVYDLAYASPEQLRSDEESDSTILVVDIPTLWTFTDQRYTPTQGGTLRFDSRSDAAYTLLIDFVKQITPLVADADVPLLPTDFHDALVFCALKSLAVRHGDRGILAFAREEYEYRLRDLRSAEGLQQRQSSSRVRSSGFHEAAELGGAWER